MYYFLIIYIIKIYKYDRQKIFFSTITAYMYNWQVVKNVFVLEQLLVILLAGFLMLILMKFLVIVLAKRLVVVRVEFLIIV